MRSFSRLLVATVVAAATGLLSGTAAQASDATFASSVNRALATTNAPLSAAAELESDTDSLGQNSFIDLPRAAADGVKLHPLPGVTVKVGLPGVKNAKGVLTGPGTVAYPTSQSYANIVRAEGNGGRFMVKIDRGAPTAYAYTHTGGTPVLKADGGAQVLDPNGNVLYEVPAPYAIDAKRQWLAGVYYSVSGQSLVLNVPHHGASYPVIADPRISFGWFVYLNYSKAEVRDMRNRGALIGYGSLLGYVCFKLPGHMSALCAASLAVGFWAVDNTFEAAANENKCVELKFDYDGSLGGWKRYSC